MRQIIVIGVVIYTAFLQGCEEGPESIVNNSSGTSNNNKWLIPVEEVFDGGPGKDGIPALTEPEFISAGDANYVEEDDLVIGFVVGDEARAYPHHILDWHEIVNDKVGNVNISVTYCPLTGTGIGWNREINDRVTTFGVSGLLYNSNLIPYDRETDSNWSQIRLDCVNGQQIGTEIETFTMVETTWRTWKEMYPFTLVVSSKTGHNRSYGRYPYGSYRSSNNYLIFPVTNEDERLPNKDRVHGIIFSGSARVYPLSEFGEKVKVIADNLEGRNFVVVGNAADNFAVSFVADPGDGTSLSFEPVQEEYPIVMTDNEGNLWDIFGIAVAGPRKGTRLENGRSFMGYWFSFAAFYPDVTIYGES